LKKKENQSFQLDARMKAIYEDMVGGPDFGNMGGMSPTMQAYHDKRVAEILGKRAESKKKAETKAEEE